MRVPAGSREAAGPSVLLCTEGTYPYVGGGVSTWCDILCKELAEVEYTILAVTGTPEVALKYELPANVRGIIHVPLWGTQDPADFVLPDLAFSTVYERKHVTTDDVIEREFVPLLRALLRGMEVEGPDVAFCGPVLHRMWRYFLLYDWNITWKSRPAWAAFTDEVMRPYREESHALRGQERPRVFDLTTSMRWLYSFLMPLTAPIPRVDVVHATIAAFTALPGIVAKFEYGTPLLITDHGVYIRERYIAVSSAPFTFFCKRFLINLAGLVSKLVYVLADVVSPVADFNRRWEIPYGAAPEKIRTIYNGIDPDVFVPRPKPEKTAARPTVVAAARIFPLKDIETMIRAAAVARSRIPDVHFLVYGNTDADIPYVERCRALIAELGLEATFELPGFHSRPSEVYTEGDISALSSISEGFPFTVLESMACARPVVGTDVGGVREALEGFGVVVPPRDPDAFGEGVITLLENDEMRVELGRRAREQVLLRFRTATSVDGYRQLYDELIHGRRSGGVLAEAAAAPV